MVSGKAELKRLKIKRSFKAWIKQECKVPYRRGYNYMRVYQAALEDPAIKKMGLTEAYVHMRLVKRKPAVDNPPDVIATAQTDTSSTADLGGIGVQSITAAADAPVVKRRVIAMYEVVKHTDAYVLEIDGDPASTLMDVLSDIENVVAAISDGGLLLKLGASSPVKK